MDLCSLCWADSSASKIVREGGLQALGHLIQSPDMYIKKESFRAIAALSQSGEKQWKSLTEVIL